MLESIEWRMLPFAGGLLDQPDWLMEDLMVLSWLKRNLEDKLKPAPSSIEVGQIRRRDGG